MKIELGDNLPEKIRVGVTDKKVSGVGGYTNAIRFSNGVVAMNNPNQSRMGTYVVYSGSAIANVMESMEDVIDFHMGMGHRISRLDLAVDAIDSDLDIWELAQQYKEKKCKTAAKSGAIMKDLDYEGDTLYIGSTKKRKKLLRVYNKAVEMGLDGINWKRIELQLMRPSSKEALEIVRNDMGNNKGTDDQSYIAPGSGNNPTRCKSIHSHNNRYSCCCCCKWRGNYRLR